MSKRTRDEVSSDDTIYYIIHDDYRYYYRPGTDQWNLMNNADMQLVPPTRESFQTEEILDYVLYEQRVEIDENGIVIAVDAGTATIYHVRNKFVQNKRRRRKARTNREIHTGGNSKRKFRGQKRKSRTKKSRK